MHPLSYQLFIFSDEFSHLSVSDDEMLTFLKSFEHFLPQRNQGIEFEVKDNKFIQKSINSIDLYSIDNKWKIDFKPKQILLSYSHSYPKDLSSLSEFRNEALNLIEKISEKISFDKLTRLGFVSSSAEDESQNFITDNTGLVGEVELDEIIEKSLRFTVRKKDSELNEPLNHVRSMTYSSDAKIETVESNVPSNFSGVHILNDINTLSSNLSPRFGINDIKLFLNEVQTILECNHE